MTSSETQAPAGLQPPRGRTRVGVALLFLAAALGVVALGRGGEAPLQEEALPPSGPRPRLVELGSTTCIPCQMMEEVLEELRHAYADQLQVDFIDVGLQPGVGKEFGIQLIPTQVFLDAEGRELYRHEGFFPTEEIVSRWKELGVDLPTGPAQPAGTRAPGLLQRLFGGLSRALEGGAMLALAAAFLWGILSILLSPCHLASIPLIVGFVDGQGSMSTGRALLTSSLFALGILLTIGLIGVITAAAGRLLGELGAWGSYLVAVVLALVGLHLLDVLPSPWSGPGAASFQRKGLLAALILGLVFGLALGPCTFAYMAPILAIAFKVGATDLTFAVGLLLVYGLGHCSVIVLAGTATELVRRVLSWGETSRGPVILKRFCGALVLLAALYMLWLAG